MARLASVGAAVIIAACVCSCSTNSSPPPKPPVDTATALVPNYQVTYRWIPNPILSLGSAEGVFTRASVESFDRAWAANDAEWGYKGYRQAAPKNIDLVLRRTPSGVFVTPLTADRFYSVIRRDQTTRSTTRVVVCEYSREARDQSHVPSRKWSSIGVTVSHHILEFTHADSPPPVNMVGSRRAPSTSPFGSWHVNDYEWISMGEPEDVKFLEECDTKRPKEVPRGWATTIVGPSPAFTLMPSSPGWP